MRTAFAALIGLGLLGACETAEGYRQEMSTWQGRTSDDLLIQWGPPTSKGALTSGGEVWAYDKEFTTEIAGYYQDESRQVTRTFTDKDGKQKTETITETFPVWRPPSVTHSTCSTHFVITPAHRIEQVTFDGDACVAPERNG